MARFFGAAGSYREVDQALAAALASEDAWAGTDLSTYSDALPGVLCARSAAGGPVTLGPATVESSGDVAIVAPGTGPVSLPQGTKAVLVDLRELSWAEGLREAIVAAVSPALATPVPGLFSAMRQHTGMVDEVFIETNDKTVDESSYPLTPLSNPSYSGPVALLVGHHTVSAAENFAIMLVDADRVTVIGRQSAGTNGNITGVQVPGDFKFSFTGMEVLHADDEKSTFHGIGIVPDIEVPLSAADFASGDDPELQAAITWLLSQ